MLHRQMHLLHQPVGINSILGQIHLVIQGPGIKAGLPENLNTSMEISRVEGVSSSPCLDN